MSKTPAPAPEPDEGTPRRSFVAAMLALFVGALVTVIPLIPGVAFVFDPLIRKRRASAADAGDGFLKITSLAALPASGAPQSFPVFMDKQDAWNKFPHAEVGAVYLSLQPDGGVKAFNARCPHLGCTVNYSAQAQEYMCPCHASAFTLDGERKNAVPPRGLDSLKAEIRNGNEVWVAFQNYRAGTSRLEPTG
jgi:Rieske Fe-S protein